MQDPLFKFIDDHCTKDKLERYATFVALVGAISIFFGVIYQYETLSY